MIPYHHPENIRNAYLGPVVVPEATMRITRKFSDNKGPAYVPDCLIREAFRWQAHLKIEDFMLRPAVTLQLWLNLHQAIEDQFEMRIALFFRQAIFLYFTKLTLVHWYGADAQVGMPGLGTDPSNGEYACAHMATIGVLRALTSDNKVVAIGHNSSHHLYENATAWLPKEVNELDSTLDYQSFVDGRSFRCTVTHIYEYVSNGYMCPLVGLSWFLFYARAHLAIIIGQNNLSEEKRYIIQRYVEVINSYDRMLRRNPLHLLESFCGVERDARGTRTFFQLYMEAQSRIHSNLISEMHLLKKSPVILNEEAKSAINPFFKEAIYYFLRNYPLTSSKTVEKYAIQAVCSENVQNAVRNFLARIRSSEEFYSGLYYLWRLNRFPEIAQVERAAKETFDKNPQKMPHILLKIIEKVVYAYS